MIALIGAVAIFYLAVVGVATLLRFILTLFGWEVTE